MRICWLNVSNGMDVNKRKNRHYRLRIFIYRFNIEANGEIGGLGSNGKRVRAHHRRGVVVAPNHLERTDGLPVPPFIEVKYSHGNIGWHRYSVL